MNSHVVTAGCQYVTTVWTELNMCTATVFSWNLVTIRKLQNIMDLQAWSHQHFLIKSAIYHLKTRVSLFLEVSICDALMFEEMTSCRKWRKLLYQRSNSDCTKITQGLFSLDSCLIRSVVLRTECSGPAQLFTLQALVINMMSDPYQNIHTLTHVN